MLNTPLPLRVGATGLYVIAANGRVLADCGSTADAHRIVEALNTREELVVALNQPVQLAARLIGPENTSYYELTEARAALRKAGAAVVDPQTIE